MKCARIPNGVICYADVLGAKVTDHLGNVWYFDFDPLFGPLVTTKRGNPHATQPSELSPFWPAFEVWLAAREGRPVRPPDDAVPEGFERVQISPRTFVLRRARDEGETKR
jgi:hypothetical protein